MPVFDRYMAVDWSAANGRKLGKDSIWIADTASPTLNLPTRHAAMAHLRAAIGQTLAARQRVLIGFDFAFGYPAGSALQLAGAPDWRALWRTIADVVTDDENNISNRFAAAEQLNLRLPPENRRFWGHPQQHRYDGLPPRKPQLHASTIPERRIVEALAPGAKSVWQLAYTGCVGSQALLGIAHLERLRSSDALAAHIAIWPFETAFSDDFTKPVVLAEIYPSRHTLSDRPSRDHVKDRLQVEAVMRDFQYHDGAGTLPLLLAPQVALTPAQRHAALHEEGWIAGV